MVSYIIRSAEKCVKNNLAKRLSILCMDYSKSREMYLKESKRRAELNTLIKYDGEADAMGNTEPER